MHNFAKSKMVGTISGLDQDEYRLLGRWLRSPFFNSNKPLLLFYQTIKKYHPHYDHPKCSKELIFKKVYPGQSYQAKLILTNMSDLTKHVEAFLVHQQLDKDPETRDLLLKNSYLQRNQVERYEKRIYSRIKKLEKKELLSRKELLELEHLHEELYFGPNAKVRYKPQQEALAKMNEYLNRYYALGKYRLLNELRERQKIVKGDIGFTIDVPTLNQLRADLEEPVLELYATKIALEEPVQESDYLSLKNQFLQSFHLLELRDQKIMFFTIKNMLFRLMLHGKMKNVENEIFELDQLGLKYHWYLHNNQMTQRTFCNIIAMSNSQGNTSFSKVFTKRYIPHLEIQYQNDAKAWSMAHTAYYNGSFQKTIDLLKSHKFTAHIFNLHGRILLLIAYFDLYQSDHSYAEFFDYYCLALEKFLRRDKIFSKDRITPLLKLLSYTKKLATNSIELKATTVFLTALESDIQSEVSLSQKSWILNKIKSLEEKAVK